MFTDTMHGLIVLLFPCPLSEQRDGEVDWDTVGEMGVKHIFKEVLIHISNISKIPGQ